MNELDLNKIPSLVESGELSERQALNKIAVFIYTNLPLFQLHRYDNDFREDVIADFLEGGSHFLGKYNPKIGTFFPFLYSHITRLIQKKVKSKARLMVLDACSIQDQQTEALFDSEKYGVFTPVFLAENKAPYSAKRIRAEDLKKGIEKPLMTRKQKIIFIVLLKYIFFIDEDSLYEICNEYSLNYDLVIQYAEICKKSLNHKIEQIREKEYSRNNSYFFHKNYKSRLNYVSEDVKDEDDVKSQSINRKLNMHTKVWKSKNFDLQKRAGHLVTSNKVIAKLMNICERQVRYYIEVAWKLNQKEEGKA